MTIKTALTHILKILQSLQPTNPEEEYYMPYIKGLIAMVEQLIK